MRVPLYNHWKQKKINSKMKNCHLIKQQSTYLQNAHCIKSANCRPGLLGTSILLTGPDPGLQVLMWVSSKNPKTLHDSTGH
jgi:hypothetical protein